MTRTTFPDARRWVATDDPRATSMVRSLLAEVDRLADRLDEVQTERNTAVADLRRAWAESDQLRIRIAELEARPTILIADTISGTVKM